MRVLILCSLFLTSNYAFASQNIFDSWTEGGKNCALQFDAEPTVNWDTTTELPLSFTDVSLKFKDWAATTLKSSEEAHVVSFNLTSVAAEGLEDNYWLFKIGYVVFENGKPATKFNRKVVIDLSGKVIEVACDI